MKQTRRGSTDDWSVVTLAIAIAMLGLGLFAGYEWGHDNGVRDGISGAFTVVHLPNGDSIVVRVRNPTKEPP